MSIKIQDKKNINYQDFELINHLFPKVFNDRGE